MADANCSAADHNPRAATTTTSHDEVWALRSAVAIRRPVNTAMISEASCVARVPSDISTQAVRAQPEITNGAVLSGWRTDSGAADPP